MKEKRRDDSTKTVELEKELNPKEKRSAPP